MYNQYVSTTSIRPERATAIICRELEKACIDIIMCTQWSTTSRFRQHCWKMEKPTPADYISIIKLSSGVGEKRSQQALVLPSFNKLAAQPGINPIPINDRLMSVRITVKKWWPCILLHLLASMHRLCKEHLKRKNRFMRNLGIASHHSSGRTLMLVLAKIGNHGLLPSASTMLETWTQMVLYSSAPDFNFLHNVPTQRSSKEYMGPLAVKALASAWPCTSKPSCKATHYSGQSQPNSRLFHWP